MDFSKCKFSQEKTKYNTARVVVWNEFKVINSFTLETSMYAKEKISSKGTKRGMVQMVDKDFESIAINLLKALRQFV